jgi:hypothetical protein
MKEPYEKIPLNIVMTYPVHWSQYAILRDFVQNFYDSVGYLEWNSKFKYSYDGNELSMWIEGVTFNYEWLLHIGASTKTAHSELYAGYFGEGFKIASLCAYRDFGWGIHMMSENWHLDVITIEQKIDNITVKMLGYGMKKCVQSSESRLILENISEYEYRTFKTVLSNFYYPENPIMGKNIWAGKAGAVYLRSNNEINESLPTTSEYGRKGAVFCGFQMLGTCPFDIVVCLHKYKKEDRERRALYTFEVINIFQEICYYIDAKCAMVLLEKLRRYWNSYPHVKIDIHTWSYVVDQLINKVHESEKVTKAFVNKYSNLLYLPQIYSISDKNRRGQARSWLSQQSTKYVLVKNTFSKLGYPSLEEVCEEAGGFTVNESVNNPLHKEAFRILENLCKEIFKGFFIVECWPIPKMITNSDASYHGMAVLNKKKIFVKNSMSLNIKYDITEIYLKKEIFYTEGFYDALSTYVHELCHMFGGDSSASFSYALTYAVEILLQKYDNVILAKNQWEDVFSCSCFAYSSK